MTVNVMQNNPSRQELEIRGGGTVSGRGEYGGERAEAGTGMNRIKPGLNRKSTTLLTTSRSPLPPHVPSYSHLCYDCRFISHIRLVLSSFLVSLFRNDPVR
jgi:hypothetical protein